MCLNGRRLGKGKTPSTEVAALQPCRQMNAYVTRLRTIFYNLDPLTPSLDSIIENVDPLVPLLV